MRSKDSKPDQNIHCGIKYDILLAHCVYVNNRALDLFSLFLYVTTSFWKYSVFVLLKSNVSQLLITSENANA